MSIYLLYDITIVKKNEDYSGSKFFTVNLIRHTVFVLKCYKPMKFSVKTNSFLKLLKTTLTEDSSGFNYARRNQTFKEEIFVV